jgi:hypothetical protein
MVSGTADASFRRSCQKRVSVKCVSTISASTRRRTWNKALGDVGKTCNIDNPRDEQVDRQDESTLVLKLRLKLKIVIETVDVEVIRTCRIRRNSRVRFIRDHKSRRTMYGHILNISRPRSNRS